MGKDGASKQPRAPKNEQLSGKQSGNAKQLASAKNGAAAAPASGNGEDAVSEMTKKPAKAKAADIATTTTKEKVKKAKLIRDSFTMPEAEYKLIGDVKRDCLQAGVEVKKSELLRVGVALVRKMDIDKIKAALSELPTLKAGRPKKEK